MTPQDELHVRNVLTFFYPDDPPPLAISDELGDLAAEMLLEAVKASHAMDYVPRPPAGPPGVGWLISQGVQIAWRQLRTQKIYESVRVTVARNYRSAYLLAKLS